MIGEDVGEGLGFGAVPGLLEFGDDGEGVDGDDACLGESGYGEVGSHFAPIARGVDNGVDFVAICDGADGGECEADAGESSRYDEGFTSCVFDGFDKVWHIPSVDLSCASYEFCVWCIVVNFWDEWAVGAIWDGGCGDDGNV